MRQLLFLRFSNIINEKNIIIAPGKEIISVFILIDEFYEEQAFPHLAIVLLEIFPISPAQYIY